MQRFRKKGGGLMGTGASGKRVQSEEEVCARQGQGRSLEGRESKGKKRKSLDGVISTCTFLRT